MPGRKLRAAAAICTALLPGFARAELSKTFQVSATIANGCSVTSASGSDWGTIDLGTVAGTRTATVEAGLLSGAVAGLQLDCTPGMTASVSADAGRNAIGGARQLASQAERIGYQLYVGTTATAWNAQAIGVSFPAGTSRQLLPVLARAALSGNAKAGTYRDTVQITLAW
ncbi:spore coat protein U domain-containing protein [Sphingomonadaceae bacterium G21617-S1]|uniref:Csu type fimbrial protein n=1 Tax=Rhizorhabdus sp. TaxID=1968843 RepID=UPI0019A6D0FC|nr:spore coat U domain-containing protein [Rhizorhabdus sp.]MBD3761604.1 spore coat protein U domain-containing protein [Rhizorhabdus sp.]MCZ4342418.1 spore coat protein U domain-containing protein [Sphingomonadaceae bacterium G21617-S1]